MALAGIAVLGVLILVLAVLALWREVSILEARLSHSGGRIVDGPEIGSLVPPTLRRHDALYLFLSDDCPACHEVVADLRQQERWDFDAFAVRIRDGDRDHSDLDVFAELPDHVLGVSDDDGDRIVTALAVRASPLAIAVHDGLVVAKGYLRGNEDVIEVSRALRGFGRTPDAGLEITVR